QLLSRPGPLAGVVRQALPGVPPPGRALQPPPAPGAAGGNGPLKATTGEGERNARPHAGVRPGRGGGLRSLPFCEEKPEIRNSKSETERRHYSPGREDPHKVARTLRVRSAKVARTRRVRGAPHTPCAGYVLACRRNISGLWVLGFGFVFGFRASDFGFPQRGQHGFLEPSTGIEGRGRGGRDGGARHG